MIDFKIDVMGCRVERYRALENFYFFTLLHNANFPSASLLASTMKYFLVDKMAGIRVVQIFLS